MRKFAILFVLMCAPVAAQNSTSAWKLIVAFNTGGGSVVIDYPNAGKCERARAMLGADRDAKIERSKANATAGAIVMGVPYHFVGVCIQG